MNFLCPLKMLMLLGLGFGGFKGQGFRVWCFGVSCSRERRHKPPENIAATAHAALLSYFDGALELGTVLHPLHDLM